MEVDLHKSSRKTTVCQNKKNFSASRGPTAMKLLHGALSSGTLNAIDAGT